MKARKQITKEEKRKAYIRRIGTNRRQANIPYELLNYEQPDSRSQSDRRSVKERRVN